MSEREDLFAHYAGQDEGQRLFRFPHKRLELLRTRELLLRQLPSPPAGCSTWAAAPACTRPGWRARATGCIWLTSFRSMFETQLSTGGRSLQPVGVHLSRALVAEGSPQEIRGRASRQQILEVDIATPDAALEVIENVPEVPRWRRKMIRLR